MTKICDHKHPYESPTTPGLYITFWDFLVELICLNMNPKLGKKFWRDNGYWQTKYVREISRGIQKFKSICSEFDLEDNLVRIALIKAVKKSAIKSFLVEKTRNKLIKMFKKEYSQLMSRNHSGQKEISAIDPQANSIFVDAPTKKTPLGRLREIEQSG